jgi:hypothetical protein
MSLDAVARRGMKTCSLVIKFQACKMLLRFGLHFLNRREPRKETRDARSCEP